jgi:hypothetical protein
MLEPLPLLLATPIATAILNKFYEGVGSELAKKSVNDLPVAVKTKIQALGQFVWEKCLKRSKDPVQAEKLLQEAAKGSETAQTRLSNGLNQVFANDPALEQEVRVRADEIHLEIANDFGEMTQINRDQSTGYQTKTGPSNTNFFGGTHHHGKP